MYYDKFGKQDLIDIIDIKKITRVSHRIYQQNFCKKIQFNNFLMGINKNYFLIEFCFETIFLSEKVHESCRAKLQ